MGFQSAKGRGALFNCYEMKAKLDAQLIWAVSRRIITQGNSITTDRMDENLMRQRAP